ncbi:MAG TPA: ribosomal protein L7/L12 [Anaerovoracaceae bacterium]|nr:ribosomal protein L7/L12 [Anaerovoracaceae bacterium]
MNITMRTDSMGVQHFALTAEGAEAHKIFALLAPLVLNASEELTEAQKLEQKLITEAKRFYNPGFGMTDKIAAIKKVREVSGWGLKEAKDFVEAKIQKPAELIDPQVSR